MADQPTSGFDLLIFLREFGLPTVLVLYLLTGYKKSMDEMTQTVNRLTGVIMDIVHRGEAKKKDD